MPRRGARRSASRQRGGDAAKGKREEEKADPSPPFANGATGFGMTAAKRSLRVPLDDKVGSRRRLRQGSGITNLRIKISEQGRSAGETPYFVQVDNVNGLELKLAL
jgi:hypothetical protein